ncbi:xanthine dehydrogenase family protein molybdopterin-binding subunit [Candidatus Nephthysia bennettiae]|uniref:Xanthine dehydrogenase family protein n=1 Tax=Candidatus Nephthysia bennettiae TaxID=3127016 RepID=A0A934NA43_9BACT|nr:xanthine dehydrogenase family protein [Candidatus Dormibacteraeota bacterium]MBJ7611983.1 xanthine dehydrogenase family protein [Candidatus Dormibacteraeota bacterium]
MSSSIQTGGYLADQPSSGAVEVAFVRSPHPHAAILGVRGAGVTAGDLEVSALAVEGPGLTPRPWPVLADGRVRFVGEAVAAVWAPDRYRAEDMAAQVEVEYEPLEPEVRRSLFERDLAAGDTAAHFDRADRVIERSYRAARQAPLPLETRGVSAYPAGDRLTVWSSTQVPHILRRGLARALGLEESAIRVRVPRVGGGFGLKAHVFPEEIVVAALALRLRRPVRWIEDRQENLLASVHAHDNEVRLRAAFTARGRVLAVEADLRCDAGAYSVYPFSASLEPSTASSALFAAYGIEALRVTALAHTSHRCPVGAYRGVGTNTAVHATERLMDAIAAELGIDPLELRRRNAHARLPMTTPSGRYLDSGDYGALLDRLDEAAGYGDLRRLQSERRREGRLFGIGIALFNEHSGTGAREYRDRGVAEVPGVDACRVRVTEEGRIEVYTSSVEIGQGHLETCRRVVVQELGVPASRVDVIAGDSDACPPGTGAFVSRGAVGVLDALVRAVREAAERDLQPGTDLSVAVDPEQVFPAGAHLAVVEVDPVSYVPRVVRYVAVEDCGTLVDPESVAGQVRGGVAMGIGKVLLEEAVYAADGQFQTATLLDYLVPVAPDVPSIEMEHLQSPSPKTLLGSKGVGEAGTIGAFGAVANAVADAVVPLGAELARLPYSPARIFEAVAAAQDRKAPPRG